jgi:LCP family protein required for cell wall assembly
MADDQDSDPFERYFRPRPGGPAAEEAPDGVAVGDPPAPHVLVPAPRSHRRAPSPVTARAAGNARRQRRFLVTAGVMSALVLAGSGGAWAFQGYVSGSVASVGVNGLAKGSGDGPHGAMNILIAGVDRRQGLTQNQIDRLHLGREAGTRSDTMMLVHLSADHSKVTIVSLPRDSYVLIPAHRSNGVETARGSAVPARYGKLTWAYNFGGPDLTVATIKAATGVAIDHYVEVNFVGFVKVVDALDGVDVCTATPINDPKSGLVLPAGKTHVDGVRALGFARARYTLGDGSDLGRIDRQQQFVSTLMHQALSGSTLTDPLKLAAFLSASLDTIRVDDDLRANFTSLATQLKGVSPDNVAFAKIPLADQGYLARMWNSRGLQSTVRWDPQGAGMLFGEIKKDKPVIKPPAAAPSPAVSTAAPAALTVPPSQIRGVRVLNGVGTRGLARSAATDLDKVGFSTVVVSGTAKKTGITTTIIQYGPGHLEAARTLAAAIPGARLKQVDSLGGTIQVIVGSDWSGARKVKVASSTPSTGGPQPSAVQARTATQNTCT